MIYLTIAALLAIAAWIGYEIGRAPLQTTEEKKLIKEMEREIEEQYHYEETVRILNKMENILNLHRGKTYNQPRVFLICPKTREKLTNVKAWTEYIPGFWAAKEIASNKNRPMVFKGITVHTALDLPEGEIRLI